MIKKRASVALENHRKSVVVSTNGSQKRLSVIPVRSTSTNFPGRNLARPVTSVLEDRLHRETNMRGSGNCFGFLRPTLSSMAKTKPHVQHESLKYTESDHKSPLKGHNQHPFAVTTVVTEEETMRRPAFLENETATDSERKAKTCHPPSPFTIYEAPDDSFDSPLIPKEETIRRQTIFATPKYPRTKSLEKNTKRRLQFRHQIRSQYGQERLRNASSPPPDFDVTINTATEAPTYVPPASDYEVFSTPIVKLTSELSLSDAENETVYYTPCAEF